MIGLFSFEKIYKLILGFRDTIVANGFIGGDADADAVIAAVEATGVTLTSTQKSAVTDRVVAFKDQGIWNNLVRYYGFIAGTPAGDAINWKDPENVLGRNITYVGTGLNHSASGVAGSGSTANRGNLGTIGNELTDNDCSIFYYYTESSPSGNDTVIGNIIGSTYLWLYGRQSNNQPRSFLFTNGNVTSSLVKLATGYFSTKRVSTTVQIRINDSIFSTSSSQVGRPTTDVWLFAANDGGIGSSPGTDRIGSLGFFDRALTNDEDNDNRASEVLYQTALSRN